MSQLSRSYGRWILLAIAVVLATVLFLISGVFQWSPLNCWHDEIDIHSGRIRRTWILLYCQVSQREDETWLSRAAATTSRQPDWRKVNTFSPGTRYSPHYAYHGAMNQIDLLDTNDRLVPLSLAARRKVANQVLLLWKNGSCSDTIPYIEQLAGVAFELHERGATEVTEADLP